MIVQHKFEIVFNYFYLEQRVRQSDMNAVMQGGIHAGTES